MEVNRPQVHVAQTIHSAVWENTILGLGEMRTLKIIKKVSGEEKTSHRWFTNCFKLEIFTES